MRALVAIVLSSLLGTCSFAPSVLEQIMSRGELRVVTRNSPAAFYYGADEPRGIEYELARGFAQRLGVDLRIYMADQFGQVFPDVVSGKADVAAAALTVADARKEAVTFGPAYQNVQQQVIYKRGTKRPRKVTDLLGGRLEVVAESAHAALLEQVRREEPMLTWIEDAHVGAEELLRKVAAGDIEYTIADSHVFALLRHFYPDVRVAFNLGPANQVAWVLPKKADELRESIAAYFAEIEATGELQRIFDRYYFASREFDYVGSRAFVRHYNARLPQYREYFREAELATGVDWRLLAAMAYQESHWNPEAVSPTGVRGMMMLTENTAAMMEVENRTDPRTSIIGGARYFSRVMRKVPARIAEPDRIWLAVAAYNVGYGHVEDARILTQTQDANPDAWTDVRERLPLLTEEQWYKRVQRGYAPGSQAVTYVDNVRRYYEILMWMERRENLTTDEGGLTPFVPPLPFASPPL